MDTHVFLAVIAAAACHAIWNAMLKVRLEPLLAVSLISVACGAVTAPFLPAVPVPSAAAWPWLVGSLVIHLGYYWALGQAYRGGDLGQMYPIARGTAPLFTAAGAFLILGEGMSATGVLGIAVLALGVLLLSLKGGREVRLEPRAVGFAVLTAAMISAYTLVDGTGARADPTPYGYIVWLIFLDGVMMLVVGVAWWGRSFLADLRNHGGLILAGGAFSTISYAIAIWAMSKAPIAMVAALRETSVLFAAIISVIFLREPLLPIRIAAAILVAAGMMLVRLR
jgi:drug/metabolite transporter (DMT)-like permease